ncbi:MAG: hypothetical protein AAFX99_14570, partial [Myxococcota bacterium]
MKMFQPLHILLVSLSVVLLGTVVSTAQAQETSGVPDMRYAVTMKGGFSPYTSVRYTLRVRDGVGTVGVIKTMPGHYGHQERLELLSARELDALMAELRGCDFDTLSKPGRQERGAVRWSFELQIGEKRRQFEVADPELQSEPRYWMCLE